MVECLKQRKRQHKELRTFDSSCSGGSRCNHWDSQFDWISIEQHLTTQAEVSVLYQPVNKWVSLWTAHVTMQNFEISCTLPTSQRIFLLCAKTQVLHCQRTGRVCPALVLCNRLTVCCVAMLVEHPTVSEGWGYKGNGMLSKLSFVYRIDWFPHQIRSH